MIKDYFTENEVARVLRVGLAEAEVLYENPPEIKASQLHLLAKAVNVTIDKLLEREFEK